MISKVMFRSTLRKRPNLVQNEIEKALEAAGFDVTIEETNDLNAIK